MKQKKKPARNSGRPEPDDISDLVPHRDAETLYNEAIQLIELLTHEHRSAARLDCLGALLIRLSEILIRHVRSRERRHDEWKHEPAEELLLKRLHEVTCLLTFELARSAYCNPSDFSWIRNCLHWPTVASVDAALDIRHAARNPSGWAAGFYQPPLEMLGKETWLKDEKLKRPTIFRGIAIQAAQIVSDLTKRAEAYRNIGLPSSLDFHCGKALWQLEGCKPEPTSEWCAAIKYYLYLALAPEPQRGLLRERWRERRVQKFCKLEISEKAASQKHRHLCNFSPQPSAGRRISKEQQLFWPLLDHISGEFSWHDWWRENLQFGPSNLFGNLLPLEKWNSSEVTKLMTSGPARGRPMSGFGRCVDAVLDAYLRLCGCKSGLAGFRLDLANDQIPSIRADQIDIDQ